MAGELKFRPKNFVKLDMVDPLSDAAKIAQAIHDKWLKGQPTVTFVDEGKYGINFRLPKDLRTHKAKLVCIEKIEE